MTAQNLKYPQSTLLKSSAQLGWSTLFAKLRSVPGQFRGQLEEPKLAAQHAKIVIAVRGSDEGLATCKVEGSWQSARLTTGSIWLKPIGGKYDEAHVNTPEVQVMHLYLPNIVFARLMDDYNSPAVPARSIRYSCGIEDELINQIGLSVLSEMMSPTAAGRMLVETLSLNLAARLAIPILRLGSSGRRYSRNIAWMTEGCDVFSRTSKSTSPTTLPSPTSPTSRVSASFISPAHLRPPSACLRIATSADGWRAPRQ